MPDDTVSNLRCHRCGYDLQGLSLSGDCPECACPVTVSYDLWFIRPPRDVMQRFRIGTALVAAALLLPLALFLAPLSLAFAWLQALAPVCFIAGGWLISGYLGSRSAGHLLTERKLLRIALIVHAGAAALIILGALDGGSFYDSGLLIGLFVLCIFIFVVLGFINLMSLILAADAFATRALNLPRLGAACRLAPLSLVIAITSTPILIIMESRALIAAMAAAIPVCFAAAFLAVSRQTSRLLRS